MRAMLVVAVMGAVAHAEPRVIDVAVETESVDPVEVTRAIELPAGAHVVAMRAGAVDAIAMRGDRAYARFRDEVDRARDPALLSQAGDIATLRVYPVTRDAPARVRLTIDDGPIAPAALYAGAPEPRRRSPRVVCGLTDPVVETLRSTVGASEIRGMFRLHEPQLRRCYDLALLRDRTLAGTAEVHFVVGTDGAIAHVLVDGSLASEEVRACLAHAVASWSFVPGPEVVQVNYPLSFVLPR